MTNLPLHLMLTFAGMLVSKMHTPDRHRNRQLTAGITNGNVRVTVTDAGRYLLFYGEAPELADAPRFGCRILANLLKPQDDGRVRIIDGKKYTVVGCGGMVGIYSRDATGEVLAVKGTDSQEWLGEVELGKTTIWKTGKKVQAFVTQNDFLMFYAEGNDDDFLDKQIQNQLTEADYQTIKLINGRKLVVAAFGGQLKLENASDPSRHDLN